MGRYVIRRLLQMVPVFIGTTLLIFIMVWGLGDPVAAKFGDRTPDPATAAAIRAQYHLNDPLIQQYWFYMKGVFSGDFGEAYNSEPVTQMLKSAYPLTLRLTLVAFVIEAVIGVALGLVAGLRRGRAFDTGVLAITLLVVSIPTFVTGFVLQYYVGVKWGITHPAVREGAPFQDLIMPAVVLAGVSLAYVARLTRTSVAENSRADYLRTAVAKGLPRRRVIVNHMLRNSLIPVVTFLGTDIGNLMAGALVTERIFNIQGVGYQIYQGIVHVSPATVVGFVTILVIIFLLANLLVDLLYAVLDPRIRYA
jgi:oligopeptide transport system permease protein